MSINFFSFLYILYIIKSTISPFSLSTYWLIFKMNGWGSLLFHVSFDFICFYYMVCIFFICFHCCFTLHKHNTLLLSVEHTYIPIFLLFSYPSIFLFLLIYDFVLNIIFDFSIALESYFGL